MENKCKDCPVFKKWELMVDFKKFSRVSKKILRLLGKKFKTPCQGYLFLKVLCICFELDNGFFLTHEEDNRLKKMLSYDFELQIS